MELTSQFHSNGRGAYFGGRDSEVRKAIKVRYANALSKASWIEKLYLCFEMWCERSQAKMEPNTNAHNPSPYTLW